MIASAQVAAQKSFPSNHVEIPKITTPRRGAAYVMSLVAKAAALRVELGLPTGAPAAATIVAACQLMGIVPETGEALPQLADRVIAAVGCEVAPAAAATSAAPAPAAAQSSAPRSAAPAAASLTAAAPPGGKAKATSTCPASEALSQKQLDLTEMPGVKRVVVPKQAAERVAARAHERGEVLSQEELEAVAGLVVEELPSEKVADEPANGKLYGCSQCSRVFHRAGALRCHQVWAHPAQPRTAIMMPPRPFHGEISAPLRVESGAVRVTFLINGKDRAQLEREEEEAARQWATAKAEREAEAIRRRVAAQARRDREEAAGVKLGRYGSAHRHQYTPAEKQRLIDLLDDINANKAVQNKAATFEGDRRSRGCPFTTAVKWLKPAERAKIRRAAAQDGAKQLLRIDKDSRRNGKYVPMEKELFRLFRLRRAKARKTSSKCAAA